MINEANIVVHTTNDHCHILELRLDKDTNMTYGIYIKPVNRPSSTGNKIIPVGQEFCEVYVGENYNALSKKRSYSRCYYIGDANLPKKYQQNYLELKKLYENKYKANIALAH